MCIAGENAPAEEHAALRALLHKDRVVKPVAPPLVVRIVKLHAAGIAFEIDGSTDLLRQLAEGPLQIRPFLPDTAEHLAGCEQLHLSDGRGEREAFPAERRGDEYLRINRLHHLAPPSNKGERHAIRRRFAEGGEVWRNAEIFLCTADAEAESVHDFVDDEQCTVRMTELLELRKIALRRNIGQNGLSDDCRNLPFMRCKQLLYLVQIAVRECMHIAACLVEDAALADALCRRRPLMPAMIVAAQDMLAPRKGARDANRGLGCFRSGLEEAHHVRARNMLHAKPCIFHLLRRHKGKAHAALHLANHSIVNGLIAIAEQHGAEAHIIVDVFVPVHIPNVRILSALNVDRRNALDVRFRSLAVQLTAG